MQNFNLELSAPTGPLMLYAMQADSMSRFFSVTVADNGTPWTPPDGAAWTVRFGAPGMPAGWYDTITEPGGGTHPAIVVDENTATVEIAEQAVSTPGANVLCVLVTDAQGYQIASWPFALNVQAVPGFDAPEATVYYNALTAQVAEALSNAQAAAASASAAAQSASEAAASAASINPENLITSIKKQFGQFGTASTGGFAVYGKAIATRLSGGIWRIDFTGQISQNDNSPTNAGLSLNALSSLAGVTLQTVRENTAFWAVAPDSASPIPMSAFGYGGTLTPVGNVLIPSRYYNTDGANGTWGSSTSLFVVGTYWQATIYATES